MTDEKLYSASQIRSILSKATEIQAALELKDNKDGLSAEELKLVAREAGISEQALNIALSTPDEQNLNSHFQWLAGSEEIQERRFIAAPIREEEWDKVLVEIRRHTGATGTYQSGKSMHEWNQSIKDIGYRHISAMITDGVTRIQYQHGWKGIKFVLNFFSFLIAFMIAAISLDGSSLSPFYSLAIATISGLSGLALARIPLFFYFRKQKHRALRLMDSIESLLSGTSHKPDIDLPDAGSDTDHKDEHNSNRQSGKSRT